MWITESIWQATAVVMVPTMMVLFVKDPIIQKYSFPSVRMVMTGASVASKELIEEFKKVTGIPSVIQGKIQLFVLYYLH